MKRTNAALYLSGFLGFLAWTGGLAAVSCKTSATPSGYERAGVYELNLVACNHDALTLTASIECENAWRAKQTPPRPPRSLPPLLPDGGVW
jgi:hypothetical protein